MVLGMRTESCRVQRHVARRAHFQCRWCVMNFSSERDRGMVTSDSIHGKPPTSSLARPVQFSSFPRRGGSGGQNCHLIYKRLKGTTLTYDATYLPRSRVAPRPFADIKNKTVTATQDAVQGMPELSLQRRTSREYLVTGSSYEISRISIFQFSSPFPQHSLEP